MKPADWTKQADCRNLPTDLWYSEEAENQAFAKEICNGCPVKEPCLEWALKHEPYGIWGGETGRGRQRIRARRRMP